ncbi:IS4 family transposase [Flavobacterium sp. PS2]|uniref:IS4 family transposase n=1 Tax=Flavobacterium sp. PS2 TaxID=3384157 RepID=UPI00390CCB01
MQIRTDVREILSYISDDQLDFFARETMVDWNAKKLKGKELFKLCVFGVLNENRASSRVFENFYENHFFCKYAQIPKDKSVSHSSIAERIGKINVAYFEKLYQHTVTIFEDKLNEKDKAKLSLYDSTITSLSASLLSFGMQNGQKNKKGEQGKNSIKFTIGFSELPFNVKFHKDQKMISEDLALGNILEEHIANKKDIAVFDRGMKDRKTMVELSNDDKYFVTRIYKSSKYEVDKGSKVTLLDFENEILKLTRHSKVYLYANQKKTKIVFRLVEGILKSDGEKILFLSNLPEDEFTAIQIAEIYKRRWDIERFFRFIKQELNFKHYFSRQWNGIQVMIYIILIASILLLSYIKLNQLKGYKIPKMSFCNQLQNDIIQQVVIHCGGDPTKLETFNA